MDICDPVMETGIAVIAWPACEDGLIPLACHVAVITIEDLEDLEAVAFNVAIIGQQLGKGDQQRRVLLAENDAVGIGDGCIIDGREIEAEATVGACPPIADRVIEVDQTGDVFLRHKSIPPPR